MSHPFKPGLPVEFDLFAPADSKAESDCLGPDEAYRAMVAILWNVKLSFWPQVVSHLADYSELCLFEHRKVAEALNVTPIACQPLSPDEMGPPNISEDDMDFGGLAPGIDPTRN